jgi:hypothetical protein
MIALGVVARHELPDCMLKRWAGITDDVAHPALKVIAAKRLAAPAQSQTLLCRMVDGMPQFPGSS